MSVSNKIGKVKVSVEYDGSDGRSIGYTDFTFTVNAQAILGEIVLVRRNQKLLFDALGKTPGIEGTSGGDPQEAASRGAAMGAGKYWPCDSAGLFTPKRLVSFF